MHPVPLPQTLLHLNIRQPEDVVMSRQRARQIMTRLAFNQQEQTQMTTAISEIVRNAYQYAGGGKITFGLEAGTFDSVNFTVKVEDKGPGIAALDMILQGQYISQTGQGLGIVGARRIVELFSISTSENGTTVLLGLPIARAKLPINHVLLGRIANELVRYRPNSVSEEVEQQNQDLLIALDKLTQAQCELELKVQERTLSLQKTTEHLHLALQSAHAGTWHWHSQTNTLDWDAYTCKLLGLSVGCFTDTTKVLLNALHPDDRPYKNQRIVDFLKAACEKTGKEFRIVWPNGQMRYMMARGQSEYDIYNQIKRISGIFWDITERKQAETELQAYQLQILQVQRVTSMGEMASALAHELNQPLAAISAFARGCLRRMQVNKPISEQQIEILTEIAEQSERAGNIMHRIKDFARKGKLYLEPVAVHILLENVLKLFALEANPYAIKIDRVSFSEELIICIDKIQIEQVLLNLLRNSLEAMQVEYTVEPRITVKVKAVDTEMVDIMIEDNGPGFSDEIATRLFEAYFTTKSTGMGMGLAICRTIIEAHEGKLVAEALPQQGACFHCLLPLQTC